MTTSYQPRNRYVPSSVAKSPFAFSTTSGTVNASRAGNFTTVAQARNDVATYLEEHGNSNPDFNTSTAGTLSPGDRPKISRGYIRRANPNSDNPSSTAVLKFMYNPAEITRNYLSYMDQAAIDPYNTLFQSGNLVAPPSIVQFDFALLFDREIEAAGDASLIYNWRDRGVMVDNDYFNVVVRNVAPNNASSTEVPDNGVMMVNPEDIVVVFGPQLTVQGRPINSQVKFTKFNHLMTPTRMEVSIQMMVNYFGPLREPFGLDATQKIGEYEALIPYSERADGTLTDAQVQASIDVYNAAFDANQAEVATLLATRQPWWNLEDFGGALAAGGPLSSGVAAAALAYAKANFEGKLYSQGRRRQVPDYSDCSSMIWYSYNQQGAGHIFGQDWPTTQSMYHHWNSTNFRDMQIITKGSGNGEQIRTKAQPGDILWKKGHVAMFEADEGAGYVRTFASRSSSSTPQVGSKRVSTSYIDTYSLCLRPVVAGSQTIDNTVRNKA